MSETDNKLQNCTLYISSAPCISAEEALRRMPSGGDKPYILVYTPGFCGFADDTLRKCADGSDIYDSDDIFEMRCFCRDWDMRWVRSGDGGIVTVLSESEEHTLRSAERFKKYDKVEILRNQHYVLWGSGTELQSGTSADVSLFEHRIGTLPLPEDTMKALVKRKGRVQLNFIEYFTPDDKYGNLLFLAERLTELEEYKTVK